MQAEVHQAHRGHRHRAQQGREDAELRRRAEEQGLGIGQQRAEVRHRAHAHEDHQRRDAGSDRHTVEAVEHAVGEAAIQRHVAGLLLERGGNLAMQRLLHRVARLIQRQAGDVDVEQIGHRSQQLRLAEMGRLLGGRQRQPGFRDVGQNAAEADRHQQQGFEVLADRQIKQAKADDDHRQLAEAHVVEPRAVPEVEYLVHVVSPCRGASPTGPPRMTTGRTHRLRG